MNSTEFLAELISVQLPVDDEWWRAPAEERVRLKGIQSHGTKHPKTQI